MDSAVIPEVSNPSPEDLRLKRVQQALTRHGRRSDALIEVLHVVQECYGYVPMAMMKMLSKELRVPPSRIYGVVSFYHFFSIRPKGEHTAVVCTGTACHVRGAKQILDRLEEEFGLKSGETTPDGKLGLQTARCIGCCSLGPVCVLDDDIHSKTTPDKMAEAVRKKTGIR
jgi:bidirectional [NiFe] hydrogenase diaphorase subunit